MDHICDVIVLTWNKKKLISEFIESFVKNTSLAVRLIIIDNGSSDGTGDYLKGLIDTDNVRFKVVLNKDNLGFVDGMNQGMEIAGADYVCLANNDLNFTRGWLDEVIRVFKTDNRIGILNPNSNTHGAGPKKGESLQEYAQGLLKDYGGRFFEMPFCSGFCMVIRKEVISKVGGFSPEFAPMFFEDSDYSLKAKKAGYLTGMAKGAYVWHKEHASFEPADKKINGLFLRNKRLFLEKWGRQLRMLIIVDDLRDLVSRLTDAVLLARNGNSVWFMADDLPDDTRKLFYDNGFYPNSGVKFIKAGGFIGMAWDVLKKKKRYGVIITDKSFKRRIFRLFGYPVLDSIDFGQIEKLRAVKVN
jgi:GT2 family glycosyltransferase